MGKDYYKILGLTEDEKKLSGDDFLNVLKPKYRELCKKWHPDRQQNKSDEEKKAAEENFKDVAEAYSVLSDPEKRAQYDNPNSGFQFSGSYDDIVRQAMNMMNNAFKDFGGGFGEEMSVRGQSRMAQVGITIKEAMTGAKKEVTYQRMVTCSKCGGTGRTSKSRVVTCKYCGGSGYRVTRNGPWIMRNTCDACGGQGHTIENPCDCCGGSGMEVKDTTLSIDIPKGAFDGLKIPIRGYGDIIKNGEPGDLILLIKDLGDNDYIRNGFDIHTKVDVPVIDLIIGTEVKIKTPDGRTLAAKIHQPFDVSENIRIKGEGIPVFQGSKKGDLYFKIRPIIPKELNDDEKELLSELSKKEHFK